MANTKDNRRSRYSRQVIEDSLMELMIDKPVGKISVTELCRKADVNRSTFYAHYEDVSDCLKKTEERFYSELVSSITQYIGAHGTIASMAPIYRLVASNPLRCRAIFGRNGDISLLERCFRIEDENLIDLLAKAHPDADRATLENMRYFIVSGCMGIIWNWAFGGMVGDPDELAKIADSMSARALGLGL